MFFTTFTIPNYNYDFTHRFTFVFYNPIYKIATLEDLCRQEAIHIRGFMPRQILYEAEQIIISDFVFTVDVTSH